MRLAVVLLALSFLSLSRTGFAVALLAFVGAMFGLRSVRGAGRTLATLLAVAALVAAGLHFANPFAARFNEPDAIVLPGGIRLSVSGRGTLWQATWESALQSPIIGNGVGSARGPVSAVLPGSTHPHNDYLRVFHDLGVVGIVLLVAGLGSAALAAARSLRRGVARPGFSPAVHLASLLAVVVLALEMVTDNSLVYPFVIIPVGVIVGASLANTAGRHRASSVPHRL
jgi:O-antigen ligase